MNSAHAFIVRRPIVVIPATGARPSFNCGTRAGLVVGGFYFGGIVAPSITGVPIARMGSYVPGSAIAALVLVLGLVPYWFVVGDLKAAEHSAAASWK